jgi:hypothetical protein
MNDPVIIKMASDIADTAATVRAIKETQDHGFEQLQETVLKNHERISKLEGFQKRVVYTAGGLSAGISFAFPKISTLITHLFSP